MHNIINRVIHENGKDGRVLSSIITGKISVEVMNKKVQEKIFYY